MPSTSAAVLADCRRLLRRTSRRIDGVDLSFAMIELARSLNSHGERIERRAIPRELQSHRFPIHRPKPIELYSRSQAYQQRPFPAPNFNCCARGRCLVSRTELDRRPLPRPRPSQAEVSVETPPIGPPEAIESPACESLWSTTGSRHSGWRQRCDQAVKDFPMFGIPREELLKLLGACSMKLRRRLDQLSILRHQADGRSFNLIRASA